MPGLWVLLVVLLWGASGWAQAECPSGELLQGRPPSRLRSVYRPDRVTDGLVAREGEAWDSERAAGLGVNRPGLLYDLGRVVGISGVYLQGTGDESWKLEGTPDGRTWTLLWRAPAVGDRGLRGRQVAGLDATARFLRLRPEGGDGRFGLSELRVGCRDDPRAGARVRPGRTPPNAYATAVAQAWRKALLALAALAFFALRRGAPEGAAGRRRTEGVATVALTASAWWTFGPVASAGVACVALGLLRLAPLARARGALALASWLLVAAMAWTNFGRFNGQWTVHYHDAMHYHLGARYARELGYTRLYHCVAVADLELDRWPIPLNRGARDLRNNLGLDIGDYLRDADGCKRRFTPARWRAFREDVGFFQAQLTPGAWDRWFMDHGYNATPVWTLLMGDGILRDRPASRPTLEALAHADEVFYAALLVLCPWAFGLEAGALAALVMALGFPWVYLWVGGGIGRAPWIVLLVASAGLSRRGRDVSAGLCLGAAAGLLAFPAALCLGSAVALGEALLRRRPLPRGDLRFLAGAGLAAGLLVGAATARLGPGLLREFLANSAKHTATVATNRVGLPAALALLALPRWAVLGVKCVAVGLLGLAARRARDPGRRLIVSSLAPFLWFELSSYYGALCLLWAPLARDERLGTTLLLGLLCLTQIPVLALGGDLHIGYYLAVSAPLVALGAWLVCREAHRRPQGP
ncbi:MAG: hypothetical protein HY909_29320 [Deltaproteobacteria bacterium]|nr:hypothetical protein [Deltaproteobacteria bacterium]